MPPSPICLQELVRANGRAAMLVGRTVAGGGPALGKVEHVAGPRIGARRASMSAPQRGVIAAGPIEERRPLDVGLDLPRLRENRLFRQ